MEKIIKIVNRIPWLQYKIENGRIIARINPVMVSYDKSRWFGALAIEGVQFSNDKNLSEVLRENLWKVKQKHINRKRYFFLEPALNSAIPTHFWFAVTQKINYKKGDLRTVMESQKIEEGKINSEERIKVMEAENGGKKNIRFIQIPGNVHSQMRISVKLKKESFQKDLERVAFLLL